MADNSDVVLAYWNEHRLQLRQSESQRSALTNYTLVVASGLSALAIQQQFRLQTLPIGILIAVIGLYGAVAAAKYHERAAYHLAQARALTQVLRELGALPENSVILDQFRDRHYRSYPVLHRLRLNHLWIGLHLVIAAFGLAVATVTLAIARH